MQRHSLINVIIFIIVYLMNSMQNMQKSYYHSQCARKWSPVLAQLSDIWRSHLYDLSTIAWIPPTMIYQEYTVFGSVYWSRQSRVFQHLILLVYISKQRYSQLVFLLAGESVCRHVLLFKPKCCDMLTCVTNAICVCSSSCGQGTQHVNMSFIP